VAVVQTIRICNFSIEIKINPHQRVYLIDYQNLFII
jgi:hypothetical protein